MTGFSKTFLRDKSGSSAVEFVLVLPVLLIMMFGIIDTGRLMYEWNRAEKATQMGARYAVTTDMVPGGLYTYSFATGGAGILQGDIVPASAFPGVTCNNTGCTCKGTCPFPTTANNAAFERIVERMTAFKPDIATTNVTIDYDYSGLGFSGDPNGADVAPLVTVRLRDMAFRPVSLIAFDTEITLPDFMTTLTMEDGQGTVAN